MNRLRNLMVGILILMAFITVSVADQAAATDPNLVGLWHMDGNWLDSSGNSNNGIPFNNVTFSTNAKVGTMSGSFDGSNDYVSISNKDALNPQTITVETWFLAKSFTSTYWNSAIINKGKNELEDGYFGLIVNTSGVPYAVMNIGGGSGNAIYVGGTQLTAGIWHHLVLTYDNICLTLYADGVKVGSRLINRTRTVNTGAILFGRRGDTGYYFKGLIDDAHIYNRALSDAEILDHYRKYVIKSPTVNPVPSPTASPTIILSGTKSVGTAIVVNGNTLVPLDGATTWQANYNLTEGTNDLTITALDSQNLNSLPVTLTVVLDATSPQVIATTPTNNVILMSAPPSITFTIADAISPLNFTATLNSAAVNTTSGSSVSGTWSSSGNGAAGTITFVPSAALNDGQYTATIRPTDALANSSTYALTFTIDSTPPVAPTIDPIYEPINSASITISGTKSSDSASVVVSCPGGTIDTVYYPTTTTWFVNVSGLQEGSNTIAAYAVDVAGNQSTTAMSTIKVDTTPPAVGATPAGGIYSSSQIVTLAASEPAVIYYTTDGSTPTESAAIYSQPIDIPVSATLKYFAMDLAGNTSEVLTENYVIDTTPPVLSISTLGDGAYTNNETLNIAGTATDDTDVTGITINGTDVQANSDGSFSYALLLDIGANIITVTATDSAGNMATDTRTVTLDQTAPILEVTAPADNSKTGNMLLEVSGTVDKTSYVTVKMKDNVQNTLMDGGAFAATIVLEPGYNTIEITATDLAMNQSSLKRTILYDDQKPSLAIIEPNQDIRTNQSGLAIKGTINDTLTTVGVTIGMDNELFEPPVIDDTFEQTVNFTEEKTYNIIVTATNEVGTSTSVQRNVIYDITPPVLGIDPVSTPTNQSSQTLSGTRETGTEVTVTCATASVGEVSYPTEVTWQTDISGLDEGENVITASSVDGAGNAVTASATIVLTSRLPEIKIRVTPDIIWPPNRRMVPVRITGGIDANGSTIKSVSISLRDEYGKIRYNNLKFGSTVMLEAWRKGNDRDGRKYTITAVVTNKWGKSTTKKATVTVPHEDPNTPRKAARGFCRGRR